VYAEVDLLLSCDIMPTFVVAGGQLAACGQWFTSHNAWRSMHHDCAPQVHSVNQNFYLAVLRPLTLMDVVINDQENGSLVYGKFITTKNKHTWPDLCGDF
jgi:hypothetical protein